MDCREARRLLDAGVSPGTAPPERAALGFHLAGCAPCRAYRAAPHDALLLGALLASPPLAAPAPPARRRGAPAPRWVRRGVGAVLALVLALGVYYVGSAAFAVARIAENVRSMRAPTPPLATVALPTPAPAAAAPPRATLTTPPRPDAAPGATAQLGDEPADTAPPQASAPTVAPPSPTPTITPIAVAGPPPQPPAPAIDFGSQPASGEPVTILLLGLDRRPGEGGAARMDAIIVARLDPQRQRVALLSLPRDLIVNIPGYGPARINAASVYGELYPQLGGGVASARNTVSQLLGIPIDYVAHIDFEGFIAGIDAIGGVTIDVPAELYDAAYPTMDYGYQVVHFLPGPQQMDGARALQYARVRHADSDFERTRRQQQVILAAAAQLRGQGFVERLNSIAAITGALRGYLAFDIPEDRIAALAWAFRDIAPEQVERYSLDASQMWIGVEGDPYAVFAAPGAIEGLAAQLIGQ